MTRIEDVVMSVRLFNVLRNNGCNTLEELADKTIEQVRVFAHCGKATITEAKDLLRNHGMRFRNDPARVTVATHVEARFYGESMDGWY